MKNRFLKFAFIASLAMLFVLSGCKKDDEFTLAKCLSGTDWTVTSFQEDGNELIGSASFYSAASLEFGKYSKADQRGAITYGLLKMEVALRPYQGIMKF